MSDEDYDYITCDDRLFRGRFQTPLADQGTERRFERGLETTARVLSSFEQLIQPTNCSFQIVDSKTSETYEEQLTSTSGLTKTEVVETMREIAEPLAEPLFVDFDLKGSVRVTLSDGIRYVPDCDDQSVVQSVSDNVKTPLTPLEIHIGQTSVHRPCRTEVIDVIGRSRHWLDGDLEKFYLPEATPLATIDQRRLEFALHQVYSATAPLQLSFDMFEDSDGWHTPRQTVPGCEALELRHAVEWVLENFSQQRADNTIRFEYTGDEFDPRVNHALGCSPETKFDVFLRKGFPADRFGTGTTAIVAYPEHQQRFRKKADNSWESVSE